MCRNIKTLANFDPPATDEEIRASALQFVRKLSGTTRPSRANQDAFDEAIEEVEKALDGALAAGADRFRVVHGHGTGRLREGLRDHLRKHPSVSRLRAADPREGGNGATIVDIK